MTSPLKVGPVVAADGQTISGRADKTGAQVISSIHGKYAESVLRGNVYSAANTAAKAISVALTTPYTGLCVSNPAGSGKNLVMLACQYAISVAEAAIATQHLVAGYSAAGVVTHTVALPAPGIQNGFINGTSSAIANADTEATIVNPYYLMPIRGGFTAGALGGPGSGQIIDLEGMFIIQPGGWIAFGALTAITGFGGFVWEEMTA